MSHGRDLVDAIKKTFADYASALLHEIVQSDDRERWSLEALEAAREVLLDRATGYAQEPVIAKEPLPDPPASPDPLSLAFLFGVMAVGAVATFGGGGHILFIPRFSARNKDRPDPDLPVPFGPKTAWLALDTMDTAEVATALGLQEARAATWVDGISASSDGSSIFVTPPLGEWTLAVGAALFPHDRVEAFVKPLLERLSRQFGDAQYFGTHRDFELHLWARARQGRLVRGYGWLGNRGLTLWEEGRQTNEERELGFLFVDGPSAAVAPTETTNVTVPDESCVLQIASLWSVDPTTLDEHFKEPVMGLLGKWDGRG